MNLTEFIYSYPNMICSDYGESEFAAIRVLCPGLSSPKLGKLLNFACRFMEKEESYVEIGSFTGYTLISASHHNSNKRFIGIDNMRLLGDKSTPEQKEWVRNRLRINLEHFKSGNHFIIEDDYRNVKLPEQTKIGVFLIDGHHTREEAYDNFRWVKPYLSDSALIGIDDISISGVGEGVKNWVRDHPEEYEEFFRMNVYHPPDNIDHWSPAFWNGLSLVSFRRKNA